jgi:hypothetical protein
VLIEPWGPVQRVAIPLRPAVVGYWVRAPIPGLSQAYRGQRRRAVRLGAATLVAAGAFVAATVEHNDRLTRYNAARTTYFSGTDEIALPGLRAEAESLRDEARQSFAFVVGAGGMLATVYAVHLFDLAKFRGPFRSHVTLAPSIGASIPITILISR